MPMAIPIVAGALSVSAGLAATGIVGGLMVAGGAMTIIGTVTGNSKLAKIGGILSLAGGVGNLLAGATETVASEVAQQSIADAGTEVMKEAASPALESAAGTAAETATSAVADTATKGLGELATAAPEASGGLIAGNSGGVVPPGPQAIEAAANSGLKAAAAQPGPQAIEGLAASGTGAPAVATPGVDALSAPTVQGTAPPAVDMTGVSGAQAPSAQIQPGPQAIEKMAGMPSGPAESGGLIKGAWNEYGKPALQFMKENPSVALMGGQMLAGMGQGYMQQQSEQSRLDYLREQRDKLNQSIIGLQMPKYQAPR